MAPGTVSKAPRPRPASAADDAKRLASFADDLLPCIKPCVLISGAILIASLVGPSRGDEMLQTTMYDPHARELLTAQKDCHRNLSCTHARLVPTPKSAGRLPADASPRGCATCNETAEIVRALGGGAVGRGGAVRLDTIAPAA
eukprot:4897305-Prymnesium_polylepis.1